jgi:hypothetical protein
LTFLTFVLHHTVITGGQVNYVESTFEDDFGSFNLTRWMPTGSYSDGTTKPTVVTPFGAIAQGPSQDHCPAAGAVGAASPGTCTLLDPAMLETNVDLTEHGYVKDTAAVPADTGKGAVMTLSQSECYNAETGVNNPDCCSVSTLKNGQKARRARIAACAEQHLTVTRCADPSVRLLGRHAHLLQLRRAVRRVRYVSDKQEASFGFLTIYFACTQRPRPPSTSQ